MTYDGRLRASDYCVLPVGQAEAKAFVVEHHYAKGCSNTATHRHGLYHWASSDLLGIVMWLPPTKVAAQSVDPMRWTKVIALSRMCIDPRVPKNACSFLLGRSLRLIKREARFLSFVTYADEAEGHEGGVYRACGWQEIGRSSASPKWVDPSTGRTVARLSTRTRSNADMRALGYEQVGVFGKRKFVLYPGNTFYDGLLRLNAVGKTL